MSGAASPQVVLSELMRAFLVPDFSTCRYMAQCLALAMQQLQHVLGS